MQQNFCSSLINAVAKYSTHKFQNVSVNILTRENIYTNKDAIEYSLLNIVRT